jgi:hypothetical protein
VQNLQLTITIAAAAAAAAVVPLNFQILRDLSDQLSTRFDK